MLKNGHTSPAGREAAERIMADPPPEPIWITHLGVVASLTDILQIEGYTPIPGFCEVREIEI